MPSQDAEHASDPEARRLSRRSLLYGAATAGAAGLAATAMGAGPARAATAAGPIVVHVRDAASGDMEVFHGTSQTRLADRDLAARIARALP